MTTCAFVSQPLRAADVPGQRRPLQAVALAALATDLESGAQAEDRKLELTIYPDGSVWSYADNATIVWQNGRWFGLEVNFAPAADLAGGHALSRASYDAMTGAAKPRTGQ